MFHLNRHYIKKSRSRDFDIKYAKNIYFPHTFIALIPLLFYNIYMDKKTYAEKTNKILLQLPDFCQIFIYGLGAATAFSTRYEYTKDIYAFFEWLLNNHPEISTHEKVSEITTKDLENVSIDYINNYITWRSGKNEPKTVARKKASISVLYKYLYTHKKISQNPVEGTNKVALPERELIYLTDEEQEKFLEVVYHGTGMTKRQLKIHEIYRQRDYLLYSLLLDTGLRVSELCNIDIKDIDIDDHSVIVTRKGNKIELVYYGDNTGELLEDYIMARTGDGADGYSPLFITQTGSRLSVRAVEDMTKKYAKIALPQKADHITPHKMRSSYAMSLYEASGNNLLLVQKSLSHKNLTTTNIYAKAADKDKKNARNLISEMKKKKSLGNPQE